MIKYNNYRNYFALNKYIENLPRIKLKKKNIKKFFENPDSIVMLSFYKTLIFFKCLFKYSLELFKGGKYLISLFSIKQKNIKDYAIILGNGPSLNSLNTKKFKQISSFFDIFVVNNFLENKIFNKVIPNFFVISDPDIFRKDSVLSKKKENRIISYLKNNSNINIFVPVLMCKKFISIFGLKRIFGFIDAEARGLSSNVLPIFPRGYISSTVLKAICIANWIGYTKIFILGVDNTYPRDLFLDKKNNILNLENHSKSKDYIFDMSTYYHCPSQAMFDYYKIFKDFKKINKKNNIYNLDQYSLTGYDKTYDIQRLLKKISKEQKL